MSLSSAPDGLGSSAGHGPFVPLLFVVLATLIWTAFQTTELIRESRSLQATRESQVQALEQAEKIRSAADSLARKTQSLAESGNANARLVIDNLRQRGVTINPAAKAPAPPP